MQLQKRFDKIIFRRKDRRTEHEHNHDLTGHMPDTNQDMPEQTIAGILIVGLDLKGFQKIPDVPDDCICLLVLQQTFINRNDIVRSFLINTGNDLPVPLVCKNCMHLIAIMQRRFHTCDLVHRTVWLHEDRYLLLLLFQLLLIGQMKQLTATAFFLHTAYLSRNLFFLRDRSNSQFFTGFLSARPDFVLFPCGRSAFTVFFHSRLFG